MRELKKIRMKDVTPLQDREMKVVYGGSGSNEVNTCARNDDNGQCAGHCPTLTSPIGIRIQGRCVDQQTNVFPDDPSGDVTVVIACTCLYS